jgi:hypothetical protein
MITLTEGGSGQSIYGRIRLDVNSFRRDAQQMTLIARGLGDNIRNAMQSATNSIKTVPASITGVVRSVQGANTQILTSVNKTNQQIVASITKTNKTIKSLPTQFELAAKAIRKAQTSLLVLSGAAGAFAFLGLKAADDINILTIRYQQLAGSQEKAAVLMDNIAKAAKRVGIPIRAAQRDFIGLVPAVQSAGESLDDYMNLVLRLSTLNPVQGVEGAIFAIREALSSGGSDLISLSERFNLPRIEIRKLIKETGSLGGALDVILDKYGATTAAAEAQGRTLGNLAAQIRDSLTRILERTFAPALEFVKNLLVTVTNVLEGMPRWVTDIGGALLLMTGGFSALALAVVRVSEALKTVRLAARAAVTAIAGVEAANKAAAIASGAGRLAVRAGVGGAALAGGTAIGLGVTNLIGRATGDQRLSNYGLEDTILTIKQLVAILGTGFIEILRTFTKGIGSIVTGITLLRSGIDEFALRLKIAILDIGIAINQLLNNTAEVDRLSAERGLPIVEWIEKAFETAEGPRTIPMQEITGYTGLLGELNALEQQRAAAFNSVNQGVDEAFDHIRAGFVEMLFPIEEVVRDDPFGQMIRDIYTSITNEIDSKLEARSKEIAEAFDDRVDFMSELAELMESGDAEGIADRIQSLERERQAITKLLPELESVADYSAEAAVKLEEAKARILEIAQAIPQYADALSAATRRAFEENEKVYTDAIAKAEQERSDEIAKITKKSADEIADLTDESIAKREELRLKEIDINEEYNKAREEAEEEHRKKLIDINRTFNQETELAASQLNAAGVAAAIQKREDETRQADEALQEASEKNSERLNEQRIALQTELDQLRTFDDERLAEIIAQQNEDLAAAQMQYDKETEMARIARQNEETAILQSYDAQLAAIQTALNLERSIRQSALLQMITDAQTAALRMLDIGRQMISAAGGGTGFVGTTAGLAINAGIGGVLATSPALAGAASLMPTININGVTDPIRVGEIVVQKLMDIFG